MTDARPRKRSITTIRVRGLAERAGSPEEYDKERLRRENRAGQG